MPMRRGDTFLLPPPGGPVKLPLIQDGALASPHMPKKVAAFCKQAWGR
jgi:hypothetical protein